jgi:formylglycine-generating enzyme required for sulfatase activity
MMGNVWEWTETYRNMNMFNLYSVKRGGSFNSPGNLLGSTFRSEDLSHGEFGDVGFRIASIVPEPASLLLFGLGGLLLRTRK